jgi:hypothetical protein
MVKEECSRWKWCVVYERAPTLKQASMLVELGGYEQSREGERGFECSKEDLQ